MIYSPSNSTDDVVKVTFNRNGFVGHIAFEIGGNCAGLDVLGNVEDFIETCDPEEIDNLVLNDCEFALVDDYRFHIVLTNEDTGCSIVLPEVSESVLRDFVVATEIIECRPREETLREGF